MEKNNYSNDKFNNRYNENYSPLVSSRNKNKSYEIKDYNEYIANTFEELPTAEQGAMLGDKGYFKDGETIGIAMYFDGGWAKG